MKRYVRTIGLMLLGVVCSIANAEDHAFTVRDDIEMTRFSDPAPFVTDSDRAKSSPDGKHFAIVTTRGVLASDRIVSTISIFDRDRVEAYMDSPSSTPFTQSRAIATVESFPHREEAFAYAAVIKDLRWSSDSSHILFLGEDVDGADRLYRVALDGSAPQAVSPLGYSVTQYDIGTDAVAYRAWSLTNEHTRMSLASGDVINADARAITGYQLNDILFPVRDSNIVPKVTTIWITRWVGGRIATASVPGSSVEDVTYLSPFLPFKMSSDGRKLIELAPITRVPQAWEAYEPAKGYQNVRIRSSEPGVTGNNIFRLKQYTVVDLDTGKSNPLVDGPNGYALAYAENDEAAWSADDRRVIVTNTFLSLDRVSEAERAERLVPCIVASVEIASRETHCLAFNKSKADLTELGLHVRSVAFGRDNDEVLLRIKSDFYQKNATTRIYHYKDGSWTPSIESGRVEQEKDAVVNESFVDSNNLELAVKQSLNEPPTLWARDRATGHSKKLWNPNPEFAHIRFGEVSVYHWKDKNGLVWKGGLVKPVNYTHGTRYPLVIQIYNFYDDQFLTDGMMPSGMAARHLASTGIVVLQIQRNMLHTHDEAEEEEHLEAFRSAIDQLSNDGLIDPSKVGVVGFSTTCQYVENALIKEPTLFAAATIVDGADHSYMQYHLMMNLHGQEEDESMMGSKPVGVGLRLWLERASGFNLDHVQAPLRIEAITPFSVLGEWEIYSSLEMEGRPVDLIYFPDGHHIHQRPLERLESQQGNVDWFRFWLQGYEDSAPDKKEQYKRWEHLRELRDADAKAAKEQTQTGHVN